MEVGEIRAGSGKKIRIENKANRGKSPDEMRKPKVFPGPSGPIDLDALKYPRTGHSPSIISGVLGQVRPPRKVRKRPKRGGTSGLLSILLIHSDWCDSQVLKDKTTVCFTGG